MYFKPHIVHTIAVILTVTVHQALANVIFMQIIVQKLDKKLFINNFYIIII